MAHLWHGRFAFYSHWRQFGRGYATFASDGRAFTLARFGWYFYGRSVLAFRPVPIRHSQPPSFCGGGLKVQLGLLKLVVEEVP